MNNIPRQKLRELIIQYGRELCDNPQRCEALLRDVCGEYRREIFTLINALKARVAADLSASTGREPLPLLRSRLEYRLQDELAISEEAARWAVDSWAFALGLITEADTATSVPPPGPTKVSAGAGLVCSQCGSLQPHDEIYCQQCAQQLLGSQECRHCHSRHVPINARYCTSCGGAV